MLLSRQAAHFWLGSSPSVLGGLASGSTRRPARGRLKRNTITHNGFDNVIICGATLQLRQSLSDCMEDGRK